MKNFKYLGLAAPLLLLAACGQTGTPEMAQDDIQPLSSVSSASASLGGSETTPVSVGGCANSDAANLSITFTITGRQGGTATFKVNRDYVFNGSGWDGSNPGTVTVAPRAQGAAAETKTVNISLKTGASNASGASTVTVTPYELTNTANPTLSLDSSAMVHVAFAGCAPAHTHAAPSITIPADVTLEATSASGAVHTFSVPAQDEDGNALTASCDYASGSTFPLGMTTVECSVFDNHSPALTASGSFTVTVRDTTAPTLHLPTDISTSATGNSQATVTYAASATDIVDGPVATTCLPASGSSFPIGTTIVNCSATDAAGNTSSGSFTVTVGYNFTGFFSPVDMNGVYNVAKAGSAIPVKFKLGGDQGLNIFATGYPKAVAVSCSSSATLDAIEETVTANASGLKYDATADQYNYTWKTGSWAGTCRRLEVKFVDGQTQTALFKFNK